MKLRTSGPLVILLSLIWARLPGPGPYRHKGSFHCEAENDKAVKISAFLRSGISWLSEGKQTIQMQKATSTSKETEKSSDSLRAQVMIERESLTTFIIIRSSEKDREDYLSLKEKLLRANESYMISTDTSEIIAEGNGRGKWTILAR
jgi:hypothetical protein